MTNRRVSIGTGLVAASALAAFVAGATALVWTSEPAAPGAAPVVAFVNGTAITADDLGLRLSQILPLASYHGNLPPDRLLSLKRAALDELVLDELIYREAVAAGRRPSSASVDAEVASARARFANDDAFSSALEENGLDEAAFRERLARGVVVREAREAHSHPVVTDADLAAYYRDNGAKFQRPEQVRLRQNPLPRRPRRPGLGRSGRGEGTRRAVASPPGRAVRSSGAPRVRGRVPREGWGDGVRPSWQARP